MEHMRGQNTMPLVAWPSLCLVTGPPLSSGCHTSGRRYRQASVPLYPLRSALSRFWVAYRPKSWPSRSRFGVRLVMLR